MEKTPFNVICADDTCKHRWVAGYTPMALEKFANLLRNTCCPMCGGEQVYIDGGKQC